MNTYFIDQPSTYLAALAQCFLNFWSGFSRHTEQVMPLTQARHLVQFAQAGHTDAVGSQCGYDLRQEEQSKVSPSKKLMNKFIPGVVILLSLLTAGAQYPNSDDQQEKHGNDPFAVFLPPGGRRDHQLNEGSIGGQIQRFNDIRIGGSLQFHTLSKPENARFHKQKAFSYV